MAVAVMVVGRVAGDEGALEGSQGLANMDEGIGARVAGEGLQERAFGNVGSVAITLEESDRFAEQAKFDGMVVEERCYGLIFELGDGGVGPVEDREPGYVGQGHDAARVGLPGHADGYGPLIGEAEFCMWQVEQEPLPFADKRRS